MAFYIMVFDEYMDIRHFLWDLNDNRDNKRQNCISG